MIKKNVILQIWKIIKEINSPREEKTWKIRDGEREIEDEEESAEKMNSIFELN